MALLSKSRWGSFILVASIAGCTCDLDRPIPGSDAETPVPRLLVVQTRQAPRLDGSLDEPAWNFATTTRAFVESRHGGVAQFQASAKALWDERFLFVAVVVRDRWLRSSHTRHDEHLWEQDCVELMIAPRGDARPYFEIQVSPRNVVFDTRYDARRVPRPFGHTDWQSQIRSAVRAQGQIDDQIPDLGYTVEMAIPWQAFSLERLRGSSPAIGDEWRANFYVMDLTRDGQRAAAWSHLGIGDFHVPDRFGILQFGGTARGDGADEEASSDFR